MISPENVPEENRQADALLDELLTVEPQDLLDFQREFSDRSKRVTAAASAGKTWVEKHYNDLEGRDPSTFVYFCSQKAIFEYLELTEIVETGKLHGRPIDSMRTLAYYRNANDDSIKTSRGMFE